MLRGVGATDLAQQIFDFTAGLEMDLQLRLRYVRVPTFSNIADDPTRVDSCLTLCELQGQSSSTVRGALSIKFYRQFSLKTGVGCGA